MFSFLLASLASFGLSALIVNYDGPASVFARTRYYFPVLRCTVCLSVWIAIPICLVTGVGIIGYLAIIGLIILVERLS